MLSLFRKRKADLRTPIVRRVRDLEIASARLIRAGFAGDYHSAFHGRGIEFAQVREYQPGDDIRTIDWNVTARSGVPHVKQFIEERDLTILLAVDVSGSMSFGSVDWRKSDIAAELASIFAFSAVENADRVGLLLFADRVQKYIPPRRGRAHAQVIVRAAVQSALTSGGKAILPVRTDLEPAARFLERVSAKRAVVILISDFLDVNFERPLNRLNRKHDVIAVAISDPREERFPSSGLVRIVDAETGDTRWIDAKHADIGRRSMQRRVHMERRFRSTGVDFLPVSTAVPYDRDLLRFFRDRIFRTT
jgi:uncharacterized protein (DUF58 family)